MYEQIRYEVTDPVATVTLDRPEALNAWTERMGAEVRHALARADADPAVVGVVLTGAGRAFCSGADMSVLTALAGGPTAEDAPGAATVPDELAVVPDPSVPDDLAGTYTYLMGLDKPVVAAVNGPIAGMAVPIALACDLRFMAADAPLLTAFAQRGLVAEWGISWLLPRLVGPAVALDLLLSSRRVTGTEAAQLGLVNAALPADDVLDHSRRYVEDLAARSSPTAMAVMKRQVYAQLHAGLGDAEREARRLMAESFRRPDLAEGVASFREKRPPTFRRLGDGV